MGLLLSSRLLLQETTHSRDLMSDTVTPPGGLGTSALRNIIVTYNHGQGLTKGKKKDGKSTKHKALNGLMIQSYVMLW